jgi:hypothetical protein
MLGGVRKTFGNDVVGSDFKLLWKSWESISLQVHLKRRRGRQGFQGDGEPMSADDRRMQAASYIPEFVKRFGHFAPRRASASPG